MWFARFISAQRSKTKRVNETTFYALIQYFAIILFECKECEDFLPAKHIMSLCFTFYQEVDVPGCEPYREYLFNYLRDQPIWHSLRFWNAALFYALQKDKVPKTPQQAAGNASVAAVASSSKTLEDVKDALNKPQIHREPTRSISETSLNSSTTSSSSDNTTHTTTRSSNDSLSRTRNARKMNRSGRSSTIAANDGDVDNAGFDGGEQKLHDNTNVSFSQLG
jgi:hypothetical protein